MSKKYPGGIIRGTPVVPTTSSAPGIWTVCQAQNYTRQGIWPRSPGAPTIGTATAGVSSATVAFTAPSDLGTGSISYRATSSPGGITGTNTVSPITVSGLTNGTSYTFTVVGITPGGTGPASAASNSVVPLVPVTCAVFTTPGTFSWVAPTGVTSVAVVAVGGGARGRNAQAFCCVIVGPGGGGAALVYKNALAVTPGSSYTVQVGAGATSNTSRCGGSSFFISQAVAGRAGGGGCSGSSCNSGKKFGAFTGGNCGGTSFATCGGGSGGGGAGGYAGSGGDGYVNSNTAGAGGGGGGGRGPLRPGGGGGVGIYGQGSNGGPACVPQNTGGGGGSGGSAGAAGVPTFSGGAGGAYGGGGGGSSAVGQTGGNGANGAVRVVWCVGGARGTPSFPSTNVGP